MSRYRRAFAPGGTFFFTVNLADRRSELLIGQIDLLRTAYRRVMHALPFETIAICILPDHLHAIWRLPTDDGEFSNRWRQIKAEFSRPLRVQANRSQSKQQKGVKGIWQRRFWEHQIRDEHDLQQHVDYVHYNPVKHGWVQQVREWPYSSFHRYVSRGELPLDWAGGVCVDNADSFGE